MNYLLNFYKEWHTFSYRRKIQKHLFETTFRFKRKREHLSAKNNSYKIRNLY